MNTKQILWLKGAAAALAISLTTTAACAQNTEALDRNANTELRGAVTENQNLQDLNRAGTAATDQISVSKIHKASGLIGMDVRNTQNEKLGEIKDLVLDLNSGKVSYAVLAVGGFLGIGDKYVAVPPNAFSVAPEQDRLVLNADKAKIQNAPSFAKDSWPALNSSTWTADSAYWLSQGTALGTAGSSVRSGTGTDATRVETDSNRDHLQPGAGLGTGAALDRETFRGRITSIDPEKRTMTVQGDSGSRTFKLDDRATLTLKDSRNPRITDLKVGFPVVVGFEKEGGSDVAHSVIRSDTPEVR